jgi:hypothetical protein
VSQFVGAQKDALRTAVEYAMASGVQGDVVEFGCFLGRSAQMLAEAVWEFEKRYAFSEQAHGGPQRRLWVFDSFEGFPEPSHPVDAESPHVKAHLWYGGQPRGGTPEAVHAACAMHIDGPRVSVIPGWFKDTLPRIPKRVKFAVVHVDCDFYESTVQVLDRIVGHDMLSDGATILFDDWYCNRGNPEFGEQRAWREAVEQYRVNWSDWGPYGVVGRRIIVHRP